MFSNNALLSVPSVFSAVVSPCASVLLGYASKVPYEPISRTVARPVNLAQASRSRLGEMKQGDLCTKSEGEARLSETSRLSETPQPGRDAGRGCAMYWTFDVSSCNSLGSLGETSGVALQWSGRNSMAPASGCSWWCPICITRDLIHCNTGNTWLRIEQLRFEQRYPHKCKHPLNPTKLYVSG
ncbi:hypothetical protein DEO72_LG7g1205 [Vigna unguiculata]|uniref:Uncharacterized protein n=1 Tax=Vigna unguiculata TaxID=3917 RepID=A0A4D6MI67_VIGUN|nr:hypothetical protein DEO72_LG7g1205 [Vigna unguiculata]